VLPDEKGAQVITLSDKLWVPVEKFPDVRTSIYSCLLLDCVCYCRDKVNNYTVVCVCV
jgi:hypothetical protein